jgi:hypothetical protein
MNKVGGASLELNIAKEERRVNIAQLENDIDKMMKTINESLRHS